MSLSSKQECWPVFAKYSVLWIPIAAEVHENPQNILLLVIVGERIVRKFAPGFQVLSTCTIVYQREAKTQVLW